MKERTLKMRLTRPEYGRVGATIAAIVIVANAAGAAYAEEATEAEASTAEINQSDQTIETERDPARVLGAVVVSATKRSGTDVQDVPLAVSAYGSEQLDALNFHDLQSLSYDLPNVQMEEIGTSRGYANFSIRGLGINSSIPSIDPTVGTFIDGVYIGVGAGVNLDNFDIESIEVLRGPQSVLFGRNVTGGAVLIKTTTPSDEFKFDGRVAMESGENYYASGVLSGPLSLDAGLSGKIALYYNDDGGYFDNKFDGSKQGKAQTFIIRPALRWQGESADATFRFERGESEGDGPAAQNHNNGVGPGGLFDRDTFDFSIDNRGFYDNDWTMVNLTANQDIDFGDGKVTAILGYRDVNALADSDIDATPFNLFHSASSLVQDQMSGELVYAGTFGNVDVTSGAYYFEQTMEYVEQRRILGGAVTTLGGGTQNTDQWAFYAMADIHLNTQWTLTLGTNYGHEEKDVVVQTLLPVAITGSFCQIGKGCARGDFVSSDDWDAFSPRVGLQYKPDPGTNVYATWTRGYRSGGYNLRNTSLTAAPGPFDQETVDSFELGLKKDLLDGRLRLNSAAFHNEISDLQREVVVPDVSAGFVQLLKNTADATIDGFEVEAQFVPLENWVFSAQVGYLDGQYDSLKSSLNFPDDRIIDAKDFALKLPRLAPWTYGVSVVNKTRLRDVGELSSTLRYSHRDKNFALDSNVGFYDAADILNFDFTLRLNDSRTSVSLYGDNVLDEVTFGFDSNLPNTIGRTPLGGTFSPLNKGRVYGLELRYQY